MKTLKIAIILTGLLPAISHAERLFFITSLQPLPPASDEPAFRIVKDSLDREKEFLEANFGLQVVDKRFERSQSPEEYLAALAGLGVGREDRVFFYHFGHGKRSSTGHLPKANIGNGELDMQKAQQVLEGENPRLLVIIVDACNAGGRPEADSFLERGGVLSGIERNSEAYRKLFFGSQGVVSIASARPGQYARYHNGFGSYFLRGYRETLENPQLGRAGWNQCLQELQSRLDKIVPDVDKLGPQQISTEISVQNSTNLAGETPPFLGKVNFPLAQDAKVYFETSGRLMMRSEDSYRTVGQWESVQGSERLAATMRVDERIGNKYRGVFQLKKNGAVIVDNDDFAEVAYWFQF